MRRLLRRPDLVLAWSRGRLYVKDLARQREILASPAVVELLDLFSRPRTRGDAADRLPDYERATVLRGVDRLERAGLLMPEKEGRARANRFRLWRNNLAAAQYHVACRDTRYLRTAAATDAYLRTRIAAEARPARFKRYASSRRVPLPTGSPRSPEAFYLDETLRARRTVREFRREPVSRDDLAALVHGTWGKTGELDGGYLGKLTTKTSPSAGALHPIECYLLTWNVRGLSPGLYHYDVAGDELRRLRGKSARPRAAAIAAASGQKWVGQAAFLCVMTAVFGRTLWKYRIESAYRVLWLEAGHLAQTFCLLATARGLGAFVGDTLAESAIERLIGLDGVREFPVYLCGAGAPAALTASASPRTRRRAGG